jgi:single-strand DNA-binding protein
MAGSLNKVLLIGRLGNDPEIKQMSNGKSVARLSVATSETWKDKSSGERKEKTEWHRVVIFNEGLVNVVQQYLKKGAQIYIEGQIQTTKYTDNNGQEKYSTQIVLQGYNSTLTMLGGGSGSGSSNRVEESSMNQDQSSLPSDNQISSNDLDDEVPF